MNQFGKWSESGVPHKGWSCVGFEDLGKPSTICEMCGHQEIRYVHRMRHPDYPEALDVGCVCAEKMEADNTSAGRRESNAKSIADKLSRFMDSPNWRATKKGNQRIKRNDHIIVISERNSFGYWITLDATEYSQREFDTEDEARLAATEYSQRGFRTEDEAKQAAFYKLQDIIK